MWKCIPVSCAHTIKHLAAPVLAGLIASNPIPKSCSDACHWAWFPDAPVGVVAPSPQPQANLPLPSVSPSTDVGVPDTLPPISDAGSPFPTVPYTTTEIPNNGDINFGPDLFNGPVIPVNPSWPPVVTISPTSGIDTHHEHHFHHEHPDDHFHHEPRPTNIPEPSSFSVFLTAIVFLLYISIKKSNLRV